MTWNSTQNALFQLRSFIFDIGSNGLKLILKEIKLQLPTFQMKRLHLAKIIVFFIMIDRPHFEIKK